MKKLGLILLVTIAANQLHAQDPDVVVITKKNGEKIAMATKIKKFKGNYVFPDEGKKEIKGKVNDVKVEIPREDIQEIMLFDSSRYEVASGMIGYYVAKGKVNLFKTFTLGHRSYGPGTGAGGVSVGFSQSSINKVLVMEYFLVDGGVVSEFNQKKDFKKFREDCAWFNTYMEGKKSLPDNEMEMTVKQFNINCR